MILWGNAGQFSTVCTYHVHLLSCNKIQLKKNLSISLKIRTFQSVLYIPWDLLSKIVQRTPVQRHWCLHCSRWQRFPAFLYNFRTALIRINPITDISSRRRSRPIFLCLSVVDRTTRYMDPPGNHAGYEIFHENVPGSDLHLQYMGLEVINRFHFLHI